jgi:hypothetical protein
MTRTAARSHAEGSTAEGASATARVAGRRESRATNQAMQALVREGGGPGVSEGAGIDAALAALGTPGASLGRSIFLSRALPAANRARILAHETRHMAQVGGRDTDRARPVRLGPTDDGWERDAAAPGPPLAGADPQVVRRYPPGEQSSDGSSTCEPGDPEPLFSTPAASEAEAATCDIDTEDALASVSEPLTSLDPDALSCEPERPDAQVCMPPFADASFDPEAVDVENMRNDTLNSESIQVDEWVGTHGETSPPDPDLPAYRRLRQRLRGERGVRVQNGHLWMTTAVDPMPEELLMLQAISGETIIIRVHTSFAAGTPTESFPGPIMTRQQFDDHLAELGIPILTEEEYARRLIETAEQIAPELFEDLPAFGETGEPAPMPFIEGLEPSGGLPLLAGQVGSHAVGGSGLYRSPTSIALAPAFSERFLAASGSGNEIMSWRGGIGEAAFQGSPPSGFGLATTPLNDLSWTNYNYATPRVQTPAQRNYPVFDFERTGGVGAQILGVRRISVKTSLSAEFARASDDGRRISGRLGYYLEGTSAMLDAGSRTSSLQHYIRNQPGQAGTAPGTSAYISLRSQIIETAQIAVNADDVRPMRDWLRRVPDNWNMFQVRPIYSAMLREHPVEVDTPSGRVTIDSASALDAAGLTEAQRRQIFAQIGDRAAGLVVSSGVPTSAVRGLHGERQRVPAGMDPESLGRTVTPDFIESGMHGGGARGTSIASAHSGLRGGAGGSVIAVLTTAGIMFFDEADHPDWEDELMRSGGLGALGGLVEGGLETAITSAGTRYAISRGGTGMLIQQGATRLLPQGMPMSTGLRVGGAGAAGVIGGVLLEGVDMLSDERENSVEEVVVRTGRAAVIGGGSAMAGAAIGTAVGGPIGFVAGLAIGFAIGLAGEYLLPGGREHWERRHREEQARQRRLEEERRRREAEERRLAADRARLARLDRPLSGESASAVGIEGLYGLPVTNPLFMTCEPGVEPTVGELEREYLRSVLMMAERSGQTVH